VRRGSASASEAEIAPESRLIADVQMPGMSGLDLYHRLTTSRKPVPIVPITAYPDDGARKRARSAGVIVP
jgi:CheY-like chemotaxis protein